MIEFLKTPAASVAPPETNGLVLFADTDNLHKVKNDAGQVTVLGNGIKNIARTAGTGAAGTTDTYTVTLDDNATRTFTLTNGADGRSINSIARTAGTGAPGTTDTYTITYNKSPLTSTFTVYNGADGVTYTDEMAQDAVSLMLLAGTHVGISISYDDVNNRVVFTNTDGGAAAVATHNGQTDPHTQYYNQTRGDARYASLSHVHPSTAISDFTEAAQDAVGAAITAGTKDGLTVTYNDASNRIDFANTDKGSAAVTSHVGVADPHTQYLNDARGDARYAALAHNHTAANITDFTEAAQDAVGAAITAGSKDGLTVTYDDAGNKVDFANTDKGSTAVAAHTGLADPHPQYLTKTEADGFYQAVGSSSIKTFRGVYNTTGGSITTVQHNLSLTGTNTFVMQVFDSSGRIVAVEANTSTTQAVNIQTANSITGLVVVIMGF